MLGDLCGACADDAWKGCEVAARTAVRGHCSGAGRETGTDRLAQDREGFAHRLQGAEEAPRGSGRPSWSLKDLSRSGEKREECSGKEANGTEPKPR